MSLKQFKRSNKVALVLMVPTTLLMTACVERAEQGVVYTNVEECSQSNPDAAAQCQTDFQQAATLHPEVAPKYATRQECEADFGPAQCEDTPVQHHASGGYFMPMMMGYMAGRMLGGVPLAGQFATGANPAAASGDPRSNVTAAGVRNNVPTQPLYKSRDDRSSFRTASNVPVATNTGAMQVRPDAVRPRLGGVTRSGGFGSTAARLSSTMGG
jgi:uncharacterized protein YgiB involved in biofilm formation